MRKRKLQTVLAISCLALCLSACGKKDEETTEGLTEITTSENTTEDTGYQAPTPNTTATATDVETDGFGQPLEEYVMNMDDRYEYYDANLYSYYLPSNLYYDTIQEIYENGDARVFYEHDRTDEWYSIDSYSDSSVDEIKTEIDNDYKDSKVAKNWEEYSDNGITWQHKAFYLDEVNVDTTIDVFVSQRTDGRIGVIKTLFVTEDEWGIMLSAIVENGDILQAPTEITTEQTTEEGNTDENGADETQNEGQDDTQEDTTESTEEDTEEN